MWLGHVLSCIPTVSWKIRSRSPIAGSPKRLLWTLLPPSTCAESHRLCTLTPRPPRRPTPRSACWHHRLPGPQPKRAKSPERTPALSGISPAPAVRGNALEPPSADSPAWARARSRPAFLPDPLTSIPSPPAQAPDAASEPQVSSGDTGMGILWPRALTGHPAA